MGERPAPLCRFIDIAAAGRLPLRNAPEIS
jgi:hypothetical protein